MSANALFRRYSHLKIFIVINFLGMMMMMNSVESVRLLVILADVLGSIIKGVVCRCLLLGLSIGPFSFLDYVVH